MTIVFDAQTCVAHNERPSIELGSPGLLLFRNCSQLPAWPVQKLQSRRNYLPLGGGQFRATASRPTHEVFGNAGEDRLALFAQTSAGRDGSRMIWILALDRSSSGLRAHGSFNLFHSDLEVSTDQTDDAVLILDRKRRAAWQAKPPSEQVLTCSISASRCRGKHWL